jgi:hypothetical protein
MTETAPVEKQATFLDVERIKKIGEVISVLIRSLSGQPIEPNDIISRMTNLKNIRERSRYPTYPILTEVDYLYMIYDQNKNAKACENWANKISESLISYKGGSRAEYVDSVKASANVPQQEFYMGEKGKPVEQEQKRRHFWSREPKKQEELQE